MYQEMILKSFERPRSKPYVPRFRVERDERGWRVYDGAHSIALFMPIVLDIWSFSPFEPDVLFNVEPPGKVVDLYTVHNTFVNLGAHAWPRHWLDQTRDVQRHVKWSWPRKSGRELVAHVDGAFADGERIRWVIRVRYDARWARYRYTIDLEARKLMPAGFEPLNMMMAGALVSKAEERRWTHSLWEDPDGRLRGIVHSNSLFSATDYESAEWRTRNAPYQGAWVAYAAHKTFNPAILVHNTTVPLKLATCSQLFDEHVIWSDAGQENLETDGYFHYRMQTEFVSIGGPLARRLLKGAMDPVKPARWWDEKISLAFHMGQVNSFETPVDPWQAEDCPVYALPKEPDGRVAWAADAAHTGRRSIRLACEGGSERNVLFPGGAVCNVKPHHRYRLTGWIRTRSVKRFARLELDAYEYSYSLTTDNAHSNEVAGTRGWTKVSVELDSGDEVYLMPRMVLYGPGVAWFDDLLLEEV